MIGWQTTSALRTVSTSTTQPAYLVCVCVCVSVPIYFPIVIDPPGATVFFFSTTPARVQCTHAAGAQFTKFKDLVSKREFHLDGAHAHARTLETFTRVTASRTNSRRNRHLTIENRHTPRRKKPTHTHTRTLKSSQHKRTDDTRSAGRIVRGVSLDLAALVSR